MSKLREASSPQVAVAQVKSLQVCPMCLSQAGKSKLMKQSCREDMRAMICRCFTFGQQPAKLTAGARKSQLIWMVSRRGKEGPATCAKKASSNAPATAKPFRKGHDPNASFRIALCC